MNATDLTALFDRQVIITPIEGKPAPDALLFWNAAGEGFVIQPLHTARDRALLARRMERVREEATG